MKNRTIEVDCRKCANYDRENDCCILYGKDPEKACSMCAEQSFRGYWHHKNEKAEGGTNDPSDE
jgi:hypothetical protein